MQNPLQHLSEPAGGGGGHVGGFGALAPFEPLHFLQVFAQFAATVSILHSLCWAMMGEEQLKYGAFPVLLTPEPVFVLSSHAGALPPSTQARAAKALVSRPPIFVPRMIFPKPSTPHECLEEPHEFWMSQYFVPAESLP